MRIAGICKVHGYYKGEECSDCGKITKQSSPYGFIRTKRGKRTDVEFSTQSIDENVSTMNQRR